MSSFAAARVETKIVIQGEGNAASAVKGVNDELKGVRETTTRAGAAFSGLNAVIGGAVPEVGKLGQGFTFAGAAANAIPGPLGLAAAAIVGASVAAYSLANHLAETRAKVELLGNEDTVRLADNLNLSVDAAVKLQAALGELPARVQPSVALLDAVKARAESLGQDGEKAVADWVTAIKKGPEALAAFEGQFGRLAKATTDLPSVTERLGLTRDAVGLAQQVGNEAQRARDAASEAIVSDRLSATAAQEALDLRKQAAEVNVADRIILELRAASVEAESERLRENAATRVEESNSLQAAADRSRELAAAEKERALVASANAAEIAVKEAQAAATVDQKEAANLRTLALQLREKEVARLRADLEDRLKRGLIDQLVYRRELAGLQVQDLQVAQAQVAQAAKADSGRAARAAKARQAADAEVASAILLSKVQAETAERSGASVQAVRELRLATLAKEEASEVAQAQKSVNTAKGRADAILAIHGEFAGKREAIDKAIAAADEKRVAEEAKSLQVQVERAEGIIRKSQDVAAAGVAKRADSLASRLRESGNEEGADLVERQQAWADYGQELARIQWEIGDQLDATVADGDLARELERQQLELQAQAWESYEERLAASDERRAKRLRDSIATSVDAIRAPAALLTGSSGFSAKLGKALDATATGVQKVAGNWKGLKASAPDAISAAGEVAGAFVDGEKEKAGISALFETAASVASFATGDVVGGAGHAAAALLYGAVAGGIVGGGSSATPSTGSGAAVGGGDAGTSGSGSGSGSTTVNVYFGKGFVVGTPQQVGVGLQTALATVPATGIRAKGL